MVNIIKMPQVRRRTRSPQHDFHLRQEAFCIQPFMYHPVRAGETLKSLMWQSRAVTDPIANPLIGWHLEYYYFYVQLQDCVAPGTEDTALAPLWDPYWTAGFDDVGSFGPVQARLTNYSEAGTDFGADLTYKAYTRVVQEFFRDEGETWNSSHKMNGSLALARRNRKNAYESLGIKKADFDVAIDPTNDVMVSEILDAMQQYAMNLQASVGVVDTFEDYLASQDQGRFSDVKRAYRPELIRFTRDWSYPVNTVDPTTGTPSSAVSWAISGRGDKDRYFREPGFIVGVSVARPKTLHKFKSDAVAAALAYGTGWLPKQSHDNPNAGIYWSGNARPEGDSRDLFEYGDQFVNFDLAGTYKANQLSWVKPDGTTVSDLGVYPVVASINTQVWKAGANNHVRQDGRVDLDILTDLPADMNVGVESVEPGERSARSAVPQSIGELAKEYVVKRLEIERGNRRVVLPDVRGEIERLTAAR